MLLLALLACQTDDPDTSGGEDVEDTSTAAGEDTATGDTDDDGGGDDWAGVEDLDDWITGIAAQVDEARLTSDIQTLQDFGTRYTGTLGNEQSVDWIEGELQGLALEVERDSFSFSASESLNLVARKDGVSDRVWIFSAHYDSTSNDAQNVAPGADDNASGVAAVLEAARLLTPLSFEDSLWFVLTGAEEQGSKGSAHMVEWLATQGVDVAGVIAPDMIGYWPLGDDDAMDLLGDEGSEHLVESMGQIADLLGVAHKDWIHHDYCYGDDHTNFQEAGFPAMSPMDCVEAHNLSWSTGESTPHYHKTSDTLDTLHMPFTTKVTGVLVASFGAWAGPGSAGQ